ncbi:D-alanine aminotransferase [Synechococcus sp. MIT S9509]|uniref:aminotransferase class IV n=1 Tax=Synechococcus sp. MIT S9509 TaxID=1801630 RepID=UPI0007BB24C6|nr:aminotransferase class IV [Synechococcus sp. MIT S9509]KZR91833.1 D-alanine aminotransferase [Synechococcus sp. MIT S9509]
MTATILGWHNGEWGSADALRMPLTDRGLQLADGLFETVLVQNGSAQLLSEHLQRWQRGASLLGMAAPPARPWLEQLTDEAISRAGLNTAATAGAMRLNWSRGSSAGRGIGLATGDPDPTQHRFWLTLQPHQLDFEPAQAWISVQEQRNANSVLSRCKTLAYGQAIQARREVQARGAELALLRNTTGDLCCGDSSNLLVKRQGAWITPPLSSGCLPGVMRARALEQRLIKEKTIGPDLRANDQALLINSLGCRSLKTVNGMDLDPYPEPEQLWQQLLDG